MKLRTEKLATMASPQALGAGQSPNPLSDVIRPCMHENIKVDGLEQNVVRYAVHQSTQTFLE